MKQGWEYKRFDEVFNLQMGKTPDRKNLDYFGGKNVWISIRDLGEKEVSESNEHITDKAVSDTNIRKVKKGTVIMSFKLTVGKCGIAAKDLYTNEAIMAFSTKDDYDINSSFLYYYLQCYNWKGSNKAVMGITLNKATISKHHINIPPKSTQLSIVSELDKINELIRLKKEQLKDYDNLAQSIFYEMFGDPVENEKGWEVKELGQLCEVTSSKRVFINEVVDAGVPFIRGTELTALNKLVPGEKMHYTLFITQEHYERLKAITGVPKVGDLLIPSINADGIVWMVDTEEPLYFKDGRVLWIRVNHNHFNSIAIQKLMNILIKNIYASMGGATFAELKLFVLRNMKVPIPPQSVQNAFAEKIKRIDIQKLQVKKSITDLETLLASRMQYWFE